jgi:hypothetical protein
MSTRIRRRVPRERIAEGPSPEQRAAWAEDAARIRARLAALGAEHPHDVPPRSTDP